MSEYDLIAVGEMLIDLISTDNAESLTDSNGFVSVIGGAPTNTAITAARLGGNVAAAGCVGADPFGQKIERALASSGVTPLLSRTPDQATSMAVIHRSEGTPEFFIVRGADARCEGGQLPPARWVHTSMFALSVDPQRSAILAQLERLPDSTMVSLDANYHRTVWGTSDPIATLKELASHVDVVKVSVDDGERLFNSTDRMSVIGELTALGYGTIYLTQGGEAVWVVADGEQTRIDVPQRPVVDVTGAGDAFLAGLILASLDGLSRVDSARVGIEVAGRSIGVVGHLPERLDRQELYGAATP